MCLGIYLRLWRGIYNLKMLLVGAQFVLGYAFRTCKNFWDSTDLKSSFYPKNSYKYKSHTAITSIVITLKRIGYDSNANRRIHARFYESAESSKKNAESTLDSTNPQNLARKTQIHP